MTGTLERFPAERGLCAADFGGLGMVVCPPVWIWLHCWNYEQGWETVCTVTPLSFFPSVNSSSLWIGEEHFNEWRFAEPKCSTFAFYDFCLFILCRCVLQCACAEVRAALLVLLAIKKVRWSGLGASAFCLLSQLRSAG